MKIPKVQCPKCSQTEYIEVDYGEIPDVIAMDEARLWWGHLGIHDKVRLRCEAPIQQGFLVDKKTKEKTPRIVKCGYEVEFDKKNSRPVPGSLDAKAERLREMVDKLSENSLKEQISTELCKDFVRNDTFQESAEALRKRIKALEEANGKPKKS